MAWDLVDEPLDYLWDKFEDMTEDTFLHILTYTETIQQHIQNMIEEVDLSDGVDITDIASVLVYALEAANLDQTAHVVDTVADIIECKKFEDCTDDLVDLAKIMCRLSENTFIEACAVSNTNNSTVSSTVNSTMATQ